MIGIDLRSVTIVSVLLGILFSVGLLAARSYTDGRARESMAIWALGMLLQPISWGLIALRDQIPDYVSIVVANSLTTFTYALFAHALCRLRHPSDVPILPYILAVLVFVGMSIEMMVTNNMHWRVIIVAVLVSWQLLLVGREALAGPWRSQQAGDQLTAAVFFLGAGIIASRGVHEIIFAVGFPPAFAATPMQMALYMYTALGPVIASFGYVLISNELTLAELRQMAATDPLTGLFNRRPFEQMGEKLIAEAVRKRRPLALLIIDVDHFKNFNDSYGHAVGDAVLCRLAEVLQAQLRSGDLIGRMGGEEFFALLPDTAAESSRQVAERLRETVDTLEVTSVGVVVRIQVSIGLAMLDIESAPVTQPDELFAALMREADLAMYAAKRAGRNRVEVAF